MGKLCLVRALAARPEAARERTLRLARNLDAARAVREAATLALSGAVPANEAGPESVWLAFGPAEELAQQASGTRISGALVVTASGLALPAFADPDGVLLLPALPRGPFELRLAAEARTDNAEGRP